jgi:hypothetical protein
MHLLRSERPLDLSPVYPRGLGPPLHPRSGLGQSQIIFNSGRVGGHGQTLFDPGLAHNMDNNLTSEHIITRSHNLSAFSGKRLRIHPSRLLPSVKRPNRKLSIRQPETRTFTSSAVFVNPWSSTHHLEEYECRLWSVLPYSQPKVVRRYLLIRHMSVHTRSERLTRTIHGHCYPRL